MSRRSAAGVSGVGDVGDVAMLALATASVWLLLSWVLLVAVAAGASRLPGMLGSAARAGLAVVAPVAVRNVLLTVVGASVVTGLAGCATVGSPSPAGASSTGAAEVTQSVARPAAQAASCDPGAVSATAASSSQHRAERLIGIATVRIFDQVAVEGSAIGNGDPAPTGAATAPTTAGPVTPSVDWPASGSASSTTATTTPSATATGSPAASASSATATATATGSPAASASSATASGSGSSTTAPRSASGASSAAGSGSGSPAAASSASASASALPGTPGAQPSRPTSTPTASGTTPGQSDSTSTPPATTSGTTPGQSDSTSTPPATTSGAGARAAATGAARGSATPDISIDWPGPPARGTGIAAGSVVVLRGDSLWSIAAHSLPPGADDAAIDRTWRAWYAANTSVIGSDPNYLLPGQILTPPTPGMGTP